jgi:hypothetical protein
MREKEGGPGSARRPTGSGLSLAPSSVIISWFGAAGIMADLEDDVASCSH